MKKVKVEVSEPARLEVLDIIKVYQELAGKKSSQQLVEKFTKALKQLEHFPQSGLSIGIKQLDLAGYRLLIVEEHIFIYQIVNNIVYINHVVHGKTNYPLLYKSFKNNT